MNNLKISAVLITAILIGFTSCKSDDDPTPTPTPPTMTGMTVAGELKNFDATLSFSEAVYKNADKSGDLSNSEIELSIAGGTVTIESYTVSHSAGDNTATIAIVLNNLSNGEETITATPKASIYDGEGTAMASAEAASASLSGTSLNKVFTVGNKDAAAADSASFAFALQQYFFLANNQILDPGIEIGASSWNPVPSNNVGGDMADYPNDAFFTSVSYKGAFEPGINWADNWTKLSTQGYFGAAGSNNTVLASNVITITDDGSGVGTTTWTKDNVYLLEGFCFVNDGQTLTIEAGTVIKGKPGQGESASALIVARGGMIMAEGTAAEPIIFTAESDDLAGSVADTENGLWGGVIMLGNAVINTETEQQIEGLPETEARGIYGGSDDADNSGVFKYVSLRHGGTDIGEGNEINGLTLGGVGSGTVIEFVEIFSNKDDGIEFFGGNPNLKNIVVAFVGDDSFDYDQGYRGKGQFWLGLQGLDRGDRIGEHDGGTDPEDGMPYAEPFIYNATYIGRGAGEGKRVITFRDNAGGHYANSIFISQEKGIDIEMYASGENSNKRWDAGQLTITNNIFWDVADSN